MATKEIFYRGESGKYDTSCQPKILRGETKKIVDSGNEWEFYEANIKDFEDLTRSFHKKDNDKELSLICKKIGVLQHYGVSTRFLDVTKNFYIALYFACCDNNNRAGIVYCFADETGITNGETAVNIKDIKALTIARKIYMIKNPDRLGEGVSYQTICTEADGKLAKDPRKGTINKSVIFDSKTIFDTPTDNIRCEAQEGYFILPGHEIGENGDVKKEIVSIQKAVTAKKHIKATEKYDILLKLNNGDNALKKQFDVGGNLEKHINFVELFPDDTLSREIKALYKELQYNNEDKLFYSRIKKFYKKHYDKRSICKLKNSIIQSKERFLKNENGFYFLMKEFAIYCDNKKSRILNFDKLIKSFS